MAGKYYWLKLKSDFFKRTEIRVLEDMADGRETVLFYLKLLVEGIETEGELRINEKVPHTAETLSVITNTDLETARTALERLTDYGLLEIREDQTVFLPGLKEMVGGEASSTARVQKYRDKQKALLATQCNADETLHVTQSKRTEKETEQERESDPDPDEEESGEAAVVFVQQGRDRLDYHQEYRVQLPLDQQRMLIDRMGFARLADYLEKLEQFAIMHRRKIKDPYATILKWYEEDEL